MVLCKTIKIIIKSIIDIALLMLIFFCPGKTARHGVLYQPWRLASGEEIH